MSKVVLVTGATGNQGGSVIRALRDSDIEILALTRNTASSATQKLVKDSSNIKLLQGDLDNTSAIFEDAKNIVENPIWGVFSVQAMPNGDAVVEENQGKSLIDAAIAANVEYFVYNSVDRGGPNSSSTPTPVASWTAKHRIEQHLKEKAANTSMKYTILRPTAFMEIIKDDFQGKLMVASWYTALKNDKPLQLIALKDVGWFAANAFLHPNEFAAQELSLVGAELTYAQANQTFRERVGRDLPGTYDIVARIMLYAVKELGLMFQWLKEVGPAADIEECRKIHPELMDFGTWIDRESHFKG